MRNLKRLSALCLTVVLCAALLAGCKSDGDGLSLSVCVGAEPVSLDPIYAEEVGDQTILAHLYENLMRVTNDGSGNAVVTNGMAKSVDMEENYDGTVTYTFRLRSAKWSDGRAVKAGDFVYAWQRLANPASYSPYASLLSVVVGYDEARASGDMDLLQVSAKNDTTLVVVLNGNYDWFLSQVCTSPATMPLRKDVVQKLKDAADEKNAQFPDASGTARWWSDVAALVTNGAYQAVAWTEGDSMQLTSSEQYYGSTPGPKNLTFYFANTAEDAQTLYEGKVVDAVWPLTEERLTDLAADEDWTAIPELGTYTVLLNSTKEPFSDPLIRQALCMVIDRNALAETAGVTAQPAEGLVPPGVPEGEDGEFRSTGGAVLDNDPELYEENCRQAKAILEEAGYNSGADLGELEYLYMEAGSNAAVAQALCQMWSETLGVRVTPRGVTEKELWSALRTGEYTLAGVELGAVGNDAECFLMEWTSDSPDNVVGYENSAYDTLMAIIASAEDGTARMGCLHDAEDLLMSDYVLAPLYTKGTDWELRDSLAGACRDTRGWFSFAGVMLRTS